MLIKGLRESYNARAARARVAATARMAITITPHTARKAGLTNQTAQTATDWMVIGWTMAGWMAAGPNAPFVLLLHPWLRTDSLCPRLS